MKQYKRARESNLASDAARFAHRHTHGPHALPPCGSGHFSASETISPRGRSRRNRLSVSLERILHCHDMKGGYLEDAAIYVASISISDSREHKRHRIVLMHGTRLISSSTFPTTLSPFQYPFHFSHHSFIPPLLLGRSRTPKRRPCFGDPNSRRSFRTIIGPIVVRSRFRSPSSPVSFLASLFPDSTLFSPSD